MRFYDGVVGWRCAVPEREVGSAATAGLRCCGWLLVVLGRLSLAGTVSGNLKLLVTQPREVRGGEVGGRLTEYPGCAAPPSSCISLPTALSYHHG